MLMVNCLNVKKIGYLKLFVKNKKGSAWIGYVLAVMLFTGIAVTMIMWGGETVTESTESTVNYVSGRMYCQDIKFSAELNDECDSLTLRNRGTLNIDYVWITSKEGNINFKTKELEVNSIPLLVSDINEFSGDLVLQPVVQVSGELFACTDKKLVVTC